MREKPIQNYAPNHTNGTNNNSEFYNQPFPNQYFETHIMYFNPNQPNTFNSITERS